MAADALKIKRRLLSGGVLFVDWTAAFAFAAVLVAAGAALAPRFRGLAGAGLSEVGLFCLPLVVCLAVGAMPGWRDCLFSGVHAPWWRTCWMTCIGGVLLGVAAWAIAGGRADPAGSALCASAGCALVHAGAVRPWLRRVLMLLLWHRGLRTPVVLVAGDAGESPGRDAAVAANAGLLTVAGEYFLSHRQDRRISGPPDATVASGSDSVPASLTRFLIRSCAAGVLMEQADAQKLGEPLLSALRDHGFGVWTVSDSPESGGSTTMGCLLSPPGPSPSGWMVKEFFDIAASAVLLLLASPLLLLLGMAVRLDSHGPALFRQRRPGWRGKDLVLLKLRTMRSDTVDAPNAPQGELVSTKPARDPRATWLGRRLRRSSLDELPQLWNVLKGDMSLVGPRPLLMHEQQALDTAESWRRLAMKPGLTGLWQVSGRSLIPSLRERARLDAAYVDRWTLRGDLRILLRTLGAVFSGRGAQ